MEQTEVYRKYNNLNISCDQSGPAQGQISGQNWTPMNLKRA